MRLVLACLSLLSLAALPIAAHADTMDNFVLTGGGHTAIWSLPALESIPSNSPQINSVSFPTTITIDNGASQSTVVTFFTPGYPASMDNPIIAASTLLGPTVTNLIFGPPGDPTIGVTFDLDTFHLVDLNPPPVMFPPNPPNPPVDYTLTITQAAATPEPSSLILLATGALFLLALARRQLATRF